jgi:hypothetical protein
MRAALICSVTAGFVRVFEITESVDLLEFGLEVDGGLKEEIGYYC